MIDSKSSWINVPKKLYRSMLVIGTWIVIKAIAIFVYIFDEDEHSHNAEQLRNANELVDSQEYHDDMALLQQMNDDE